MLIGLLFIITLATHVLCLPLMCQSFPVLPQVDESAELDDNQHRPQQDQLEQEQLQYACLLRSNESLVDDFQQSVREKHGISDPSYGNTMSHDP